MENCWENAEKRQKALWALEGAKAPNRCQKCKKMPNGAEWSRMVLKKQKVANKWPMLRESRKNRIFLLLRFARFVRLFRDIPVPWLFILHVQLLVFNKSHKTAFV